MSDFLTDMIVELDRAADHGNFESLHEAYAVILEELDELWDQVRMKRHERDMQNVREELVQIATMAWKAARSLGIEDSPES